ncbi:MAG: hypothetical protein V4538_08860 [Bacteroidota bacterium]
MHTKALNTLHKMLIAIDSITIFQLNIISYQLHVAIINNNSKPPIQLVFTLDELVYKPHLIKARVQSILGFNTKIHARQCVIKHIDANESGLFFEENHLLGNVTGAYKIGLYYKDKLVALALFSKGRRMNRLSEDKRSFELIRYCNKCNYTVVGGLSKLINHFANEKTAGDIMTYIDKDFSDGDSFKKIGFKTIDESTPIEFIISKQDYRKYAKLNMPKPVEEAFLANADNFWLIKNNGNLKMVLTFEEKTN